MIHGWWAMASLGKQLRTARMAKEKSLEDISNYTNISKRYLRALEEDQYDILPGHVYVRGFLSSYARCVGLDTKALVGQYDKLVTLDEGMSENNTARRSGTQRVIVGRVIMLLIVLSLAILCLAVLLWFRRT